MVPVKRMGHPRHRRRWRWPLTYGGTVLLTILLLALLSGVGLLYLYLGGRLHQLTF
jgi:hypothetical protein